MNMVKNNYHIIPCPSDFSPTMWYNIFALPLSPSSTQTDAVHLRPFEMLQVRIVLTRKPAPEPR
jgi:hypothetical protein